jgi:putative FmdB family regulatory protein
MPIFEYQCKNCGHHMDILIRSRAQAKQNVLCEKCGSEATEKIIANFSVGQSKSPASTCPTCCPTGTCGL